MAIWLHAHAALRADLPRPARRHGIAGDLAYLPLIESGYSSSAVSRSRAVGMWQFMRATGSSTDSRWTAGSTSVATCVKATDAAIRYLAI
jgi:membrane-bound lytic murein transglycosylase D